MVSPSKIQHQEEKQLPREDKPNKHTHDHEQKGLKPLGGKSFYLDIKNHAAAAKIETRIKDLGGVIELFLVRSVSLVISDRVDKSGYVNFEKHKWGCASGGSGGPPSLRSIETPTPMPTTPTAFFSPECILSNTTNLRGQPAQRSKSRVEAMLERALIQPQQCSVDPLYNAQSWGIPIWAIDKLQAWLDKIYVSVEDSNHLKRLRHSNQQSSNKDLKVRHLRGPYLKFESFQRNSRPVFVELTAWPTLNFHGEPGSCPFNSKRREKPEKLQKEVKENREAVQAVNQEQEKEMTRRPRTARARRTEQLASGYCEICRISYRDLTKHVQSDQHLSFVRNDDNFLSLDTLINAGANVEAFLKLNRAKDIEKGCNLFSNGDSNLHDSVLPDVKVNRNAKSLEDFRVGDIKMVQCNGARRNLNLKLNSSHNLRTRAKHESGHLLRSKGSPWHEADKADKFYDKFPGFTIKKRAKGTIWIEEDDPEDKFVRENDLKEPKENEYDIKTFSPVPEEARCNGKSCEIVSDKGKDSIGHDIQRTITCNSQENSIQNGADRFKQDRSPVKSRSHDQMNGNVDKNACNENLLSTNASDAGIEAPKLPTAETPTELPCKLLAEVSEVRAESDPAAALCNGHAVNEEPKARKISNEVEKNEAAKEEKAQAVKPGRRGSSRSVRGRHRLSVEERLIEDNRAYYKVEVLGSKLRSSVLSNNNSQCTVQKQEEGEEGEKREVASSEKPVVVRFKRVRKSELSLLSDEAESFMFGDLRRDDSSELSDAEEQSSVLPKDTESGGNDNSYPSSLLNSTSSVKSEPVEEDSQDSLHLGRARKRRRTQAEALIKDNEDYYKFETPGSRLRYQAPLTGIKEAQQAAERPEKFEDCHGTGGETEAQTILEKVVYPSKPSPEVEKMQFSFEAVPKSEPWYQTYQRQDEGAEFWHYFSEGDSQKPFLLPYEIENFHEILTKTQNRAEGKRRSRGRGIGCMGRSPRKSPRCHASTLAIMSTIIRKREQQQQQQQQQPNLYTIEECSSVRSQPNTPGPDQRADAKSDVDEELKEMVKNIDEMLNNANDSLELANSFELLDTAQMESNLCEAAFPRGPPANLLELLDTCHELANCLENSSCASSECGEGNVESPLKRRKKRKNRTGWPGIKMKKRLQSKAPVDADGRENLPSKNVGQSPKDYSSAVMPVASDTLATLTGEEEAASGRLNACLASTTRDEHLLGFGLRKEGDTMLFETRTTSDSCRDELAVVDDASKVGKEDVSLGRTNDANIESCTGSSARDPRTETDENFAFGKDYAFKEEGADIVEVSENDPGNNENHENVFRSDANTVVITERRFISKAGNRRRQRENASSEGRDARADLEAREILCGKGSEAGIVPRKHHRDNGLARKRQRGCHDETPDTAIAQHPRHHHHHHSYHHHNNVCKKSRVGSRKRIYSRRRARKNNISSDTTVYEDQNCKKDSYLSITCKKQQSLRGVKRRAEGVSSETQQPVSEVDCALTGRVTPTLIGSAELEQRRSSIEFQPVVRMMKIDDQVEMDHSILSVTIASNRRLRSSSSPRSTAQPPKKRLKTGRGQFGRWLKSS